MRPVATSAPSTNVHEPSRSRSPRRRAAWTGWLAVGLLPLLFFEGLGRAFPSVSPEVAQTMKWHAALTLGLAGTRRFDPELGSVLKPDLHHVVAGHPEFTFRYDTIPLATEPIGLRDTTLPDRPWALVLGDSFVEGFGIEAADVWVERLERQLARPVVNLGQSGFTTDQHVSMLMRALRYVRPEIVLVCVFENDYEERLSNDAGTVAHAPRRRWGLDGAPLSTLGLSLASHSFTYRLLRAPDFLVRERWKLASERQRTGVRVERLAYRDATLDLVLRLRVSDGSRRRIAPALARPDWTRAVGLVTADLKGIRAAAARSETRVVVVYAPSKEQVYAFLASSYEIGADLDDGAAALREACASEGVPFLDLTPRLREEARKGRQLYWREDGHWNRAGHQLVAEVLADWAQQLWR